MATNVCNGYSGRMGNTYCIVKWLAIIPLVLIVGCSPQRIEAPIGKPTGSSASLKSVLDHTKDGLGDINRDTNLILKESEDAEVALNQTYDNAHDSCKQGIDSALDSLKEINSKAQNILEAAGDIGQETKKLETLTTQVDKLEDRLISLSSALETTKGKALEKLYGYITMFWVIGFSLIAAGAAVAFFLNKSYGASIALLGIIMIGFASASQYYMEQIAFVGAIILGLGFLTGIGMICWQVLRGNKSDTAIKEIVEMIEILRETITEDEKQRIFGPEGLASKIQSNLTKQVIEEVKHKNGFNKLKDIKAAAAATPPTP